MRARRWAERSWRRISQGNSGSRHRSDAGRNSPASGCFATMRAWMPAVPVRSACPKLEDSQCQRATCILPQRLRTPQHKIRSDFAAVAKRSGKNSLNTRTTPEAKYSRCAIWATVPRRHAEKIMGGRRVPPTARNPGRLSAAYRASAPALPIFRAVMPFWPRGG